MRSWIFAIVGLAGCTTPQVVDVCETTETKFDGCNTCRCSGGSTACTEKGCSIRWTNEMLQAGPTCYPLCPEEDAPDAIAETLECVFLLEYPDGRTQQIPNCEDEETGCVWAAYDRLGLTVANEDDVAPTCLADGSGLQLRLVGVDVAGADFTASCTVMFASVDRTACIP